VPSTMPPIETQTLPTSEPFPDATLKVNKILSTRSYTERGERDELVVLLQYPYLESDSPEPTVETFNQLVEEIVFTELDSFRQQITGQPLLPPDSPHPNTFLSGYEVVTATQGIISLRLNLDQYASGAAHPYPYTITFTYDLSGQKTVSLADLFLPESAYLQRLSDLAYDALSSQGLLDSSQGLEPKESNFRNWLVTADGITLIFDVYQVAAYAAGVQTVSIPFDQLQDILSSGNWRDQLQQPEMQVDKRSVPIQLPPVEVEG
jgi:hypothetical protein